MARRRALFALLTAVTLLVAGCSGGGGKQSTPTTARPLALGPCPQTEPSTDRMNVGVTGLNRVMVPIAASRVRMCRYGGGAFKLEAESTLVSSDAARFEAEVNQFAAFIPTTLPPPPPNSPSGSQGLVFNEGCNPDWNHVVTFASDSQQVDIYESCGEVGNGVLAAQSAAHWFNELQHYTTPVDGFAEGEMHIQGGPPTRGRKPHDQPLPGVVEIHSLERPGVPVVTVGPTGRFKIDLAVGNYFLVGRPSNKGIMAMKSKTFTIQAGRTVQVDLLELAT